MTHARMMPKAALVLASLVAASPASQAADYLRGAYAGHTEPKAAGIDWAGVYGGVSAGFTSVKTDYSQLSRTVGRSIFPTLPIADLVTDMVTLGQSRKQGFNYGAFIGINYLWDDVVLGFEADYSRSSLNTRSQSSPTTRNLSPASTGTDVWVTTVSANTTSRVRDWGTLRGRVGWAAGYFMPFITAGVALGNIETVSTGTGNTVQNEATAGPIPGGPQVLTPRPGGTYANTAQVRHRGISYGGAVGAGVDMAFFSNVFLRAEWQYIQFAAGGNRPEVSINTARVAGAVKF